MTRIDSTIEDLLAKVASADTRWRSERTVALERHRNMALADIASTRAIRDAYVRQAFDAGAPKAQLARALHTTAQITVDESLSRTEEASAAIIEAATSDVRYSIDPEGILLVALVGDDLLKACEYEDWTVADATAAGVTTATFDMSHNFPRPIEERFVFTHSLKHPIISWANRHEDDLITWYRARQAATVG
jgi:hypothetical protein